MRKGNDVFWGVLFILAAVYLVANGLGYGPEIGLVKIVVSAVLIVICIKGMTKLDFGEILFPLAFLAILYAKELDITAITPWGVLGAAALGSIGLSMIFKKKKKQKFYNSIHTHYNTEDGEINFETVIDNDESSFVKCEANFSSIIKYVKSSDFKSADIECNFSGATIYFDQAVIQGTEAQINVDVNFSGCKLYLPKEWNVINKVHATIGGIDEKNGRCTGTGATIYLTGSIAFGGVEIYYI